MWCGYRFIHVYGICISQHKCCAIVPSDGSCVLYIYVILLKHVDYCLYFIMLICRE